MASQLGACVGKSIKCNFLNKWLAFQWANNNKRNKPNKPNKQAAAYWLLECTHQPHNSHAYAHIYTYTHSTRGFGMQANEWKQTKIVNSIFMLEN